VRNRLAAFPAEALQHLGLLIAFILLLAASGFATAQPALAAVLVLVFSCFYLAASVATARSHFLYPTMLLGAASYFLVCHAFGAPGEAFPLLSVPLVVALWLVARRLSRRLPAERASFPAAVLRAMHITVAVFTAWALVQVPRLMAGEGLARFVAGATLLGYAALYLTHTFLVGGTLYIYVSCAFLLLGSMMAVSAAASSAFAWLPAVASAGAMLYLGALARAPHSGLKPEIRNPKSEMRFGAFPICAATALFISLLFAVSRWAFFLFGLALASLVLWLGYRWLSDAVGDVRRATLADRALAKWLFLGSMALAVPLVPPVFVAPASGEVPLAALAFGLIFTWIAYERRREAPAVRNLYVLPALFFLSAGLLGAGRLLPVQARTAWLFAAPFLLFAAISALAWALRSAIRDQKSEIGNPAALRALAEGAAFPALFAWLVPLLSGVPAAALVGALAGAVFAAANGLRREARWFLYALGPCLAGALVTASLMFPVGGFPPWFICWLGALIAAMAHCGLRIADCGLKSEIRNPESEIRNGAACLSWLTLSVAAVVLAGSSGARPALCALTATGVVALVLAGWRASAGERDVFRSLVSVGAWVAVVGTVAWSPFSHFGAAGAGASVLALAAAGSVAWALSRQARRARLAAALFSLGALLAIFGLTARLDARVAAGAGVAAVLFALAIAARHALPAEAHAWATVGHLTGIAVAAAALARAWPGNGSTAALSCLCFVALYALKARLQPSTGVRVGLACWATLAALLGAAAWAGTPYRLQAYVVAALALVWLGLGYGVQKSRLAAWAPALYTAAALLASFCGLVTVFSPVANGSWHVFLVCGIVFAALFLILRQDVFAFLLTLSFALLTYDWVKASTTRFTQDVLFYLVIGACVLGALYLLPYAKRLVDRIGTLPMISIFTWRGAALVAVPVFGMGTLVLGAYSVKLTEHPKFCISCHYMGDYYESWQHSSHRDVACVQCHYEPGVGAELEGKMAGMIQLVKYISHAYDNKPHAMISNASCMRSGCHADMDHNKKTVLFHGKVKFSHERHLSGHPRGKELNCVSCHGQMVEGQHISVAETTCLTCHFYGRGSKPVAAGECQTCHVLPEKPVKFMGQAFSHKDFLKGKKDARCEHCHSQITQGDGAVSSTRCQSCHLKRTPEVKDQEQFHLVHVSKGHFDCLQCHDEIRHGDGMKPHQLMASAKCATCHNGTRHSVQEQVYAGKAVADLPAEPDAMFKAGVACDGCHIEAKQVAVGTASFTTRTASARQCAGCHGDKDYGDMLADWQKETRGRVKALEERLVALASSQWLTGKVPVPPDKQGAADEAAKLLAAAKGRVSCVVTDGSYGAHNYAYISTLLTRAEAEAKKATALLPRAEATKEARP